MTVNPETEITVSAGATGAFQCACMALLHPGDEVIIFKPYYGNHLSTVLAVEAVPRVVSLRGPDWNLSLDNLEDTITDRTKVIVVNIPGNPSGKVFTSQELEGIAELPQRHDLVFTDEIYEYFVYDQRKHVSFASLPDMAERTITISGYSKTYSITGWRIGYAVASQWAELIGAMMILCMCVRLLPCNMAWQRVFESLAIIFTRTYNNPFSPSEIDFVRCWTGWA